MGLEFYQNLKPLGRFEAITERSKFSPLPMDWSVVITDIQGSTKAIEAGSYKDVNLIGAAAIVAVANALHTRDFPFVFGGDGATMLLPNEALAVVVPALKQLQRHAKLRFGFVLRAGIVSMTKILERGGQVLVARIGVSEHASLAMFQGGGVQLAESIIKKDPDRERYLVTPMADEAPPSLNNLSCRWAPIPNRNGTIVSVLIQAIHPNQAHDIYKKILAEIHPIFLEDKFKPVSEPLMKYEPFLKNWRRERKLRKDLDFRGAFWRIFVPMVYMRVTWLFKSVKQKMSVYVKDTVLNSDYKKLDDCLRMVLDCSEEQAEWLRQALERHYWRGEIFYGIHHSKSALMTCIMEGLEPNQHVHFIDGSDGGYTLAAKAMKEQIKRGIVEPPKRASLD